MRSSKGGEAEGRMEDEGPMSGRERTGIGKRTPTPTTVDQANASWIRKEWVGRVA